MLLGLLIVKDRLATDLTRSVLVGQRPGMPMIILLGLSGAVAKSVIK
jgi:hypothetical protein